MIRALILVLLAAMTCPAAFAVEQKVQIPSNLDTRVDVDLVSLYVTATDGKNNFITNLKPEELVVKENGIKQNISAFVNVAGGETDGLGESDVPLTVAVLIDTSGSMDETVSGQRKFDIVKNAALRLLDELKEEDRAMLITFSDLPEEISSFKQGIKQVKRELLFEQVKGGSTALLDATYLALSKMKDQSGRKIILICSDGGDSSSKLKLEEVLNNVIASDVMVLAFGTIALNSASLKARYLLEKLAKASGGYAFFPGSLKSVDEVLAQLKSAMKSQYSIAYKPVKSVAQGGWRNIEIQCKRKDAKLRYRTGYLAN